MDRIKSRDATGGDDAKCEIYCEMECAELKLVWTEEMSEVRQRQVRFLAQVFRHNPLTGPEIITCYGLRETE